MAAPTIIAGLKQTLRNHVPFSVMDDEDLDFLLGHTEVAYFAPDETLLAPSPAPSEFFYIVKQGRVRGLLGGDPQKVAFEARPGDSFPVAALIAERPVALTYVACADTFCLLLPRDKFFELGRRSTVWNDYCRRRLGAMLDLSRQQLQATYATEASAERTLGLPLEELVRGEPIACRPDQPLREAFMRMEQANVGSILVTEQVDGGERLLGILTRTDVIGRVVLPEVPLDTPIAKVMSTHVLTLDCKDTAADATLLMADHRIRHVPVTRTVDGAAKIIGIVSERDLFALQRLSLRQLATGIRRAADVDSLASVAADIRRFSFHLVAQGVGAEQLTRLISHLNDQMIARLVAMGAERFGQSPENVCWLALGSEGRAEQTIATDQDNGILHVAGADSAQLLKMADWINVALDQCGFPLCKGNIMARNPQWCLSADAWTQLFVGWIDRGDPQSLLNASIFFDFRPVFGNSALADDLRRDVVARAQRNVRFIKQMSDNALRNRAPAPGGLLDTLLGADGRGAPVDLKMHGTVIFVDAARIWALAAGLKDTNTAARLRRLGELGKLPGSDVDGWIDAFEFLQLMRLRGQHARVEGRGAAGNNPNVVDPATLSTLDRRILKEAFRQGRKVQQRLELDFPG